MLMSVTTEKRPVQGHTTLQEKRRAQRQYRAAAAVGWHGKGVLILSLEAPGGAVAREVCYLSLAPGTDPQSAPVPRGETDPHRRSYFMAIDSLA